MNDPLFPEGPTLQAQCPSCGLINPDSAMRCGCGYLFQPETEAPPASSFIAEAGQPIKRVNKKQAWVKAAAIVAFLQAAGTSIGIWDASIIERFVVDYDRLWGSVGIIAEIILFVALGIAVIKRRLWGSYALVTLTGLELIFKFYLGVSPWIHIIYVGICFMGAKGLETSEHHAPAFQSLNWRVVVQSGLVGFGGDFLIGFVYGYMGFREVMGTVPTFWLSEFAWYLLIFAHAGNRGKPWALETTLATGVLVRLIVLVTVLPFSAYQGATWGDLFGSWLAGGFLTMGAAALGWGFSYLIPTSGNGSEKTGANYLIRHWRGELSLAKSFWLNYFGLNIAFSLTYVLLESSGVDEESSIIYFHILNALICFNLIVFIWQIVGLWRAAQNYIRNRGRVAWARLAQVLIFLVSIYNIALIPALVDSAKISLGLDDIRDPKITLNADKSEIIIDGHIAFGLTKKLELELNSAPNVWLVRLNSDGGYALEGRRLHFFIKGRQLSTYTETGCFSACTDAFIAGRERILKTGSQLGFHQSWFTGMPYRWIKGEDEKTKRLFLEAGIKKDFVEKAFSISGDDMWFPSLQELIEAGVITHTYDGINSTDHRS